MGVLQPASQNIRGKGPKLRGFFIYQPTFYFQIEQSLALTLVYLPFVSDVSFLLCKMITYIFGLQRIHFWY